MKRLLTGLAVVGVGVLGVAVPAGADGELGVEVPAGESLFHLEDIAPGMTGSERLVITNNSTDPGDLVVEVVDLVDHENGCNDPELDHPDTTCEPDGGELSRDLQVTVSDDDGATYYEGTVRDLSSGALIDTSLPSGESLALAFDWEFAYSSPNDTQTDRVEFDIEISLANDTDSTEVLGVTERRGNPVSVPGSTLPRTGLELAGLARAGVIAILLGAAFAAARRRS